MQQAAIPGFRLSKARFSTRVLTTLGLLGLLLGLMSAAGLTLSRTGVTPTSVQSYYLGATTESGLDAMLASNTKRPFGELAEVTHLHLVGGTMLLFFLCHLLSVCEVSEKLRISLYVLAFASFLLTFGLPWLIVYVSAVFAFVFGPSIVTFIIALILLTLIPLKEMWLTNNT